MNSWNVYFSTGTWDSLNLFLFGLVNSVVTIAVWELCKWVTRRQEQKRMLREYIEEESALNRAANEKHQRDGWTEPSE